MEASNQAEIFSGKDFGLKGVCISQINWYVVNKHKIIARAGTNGSGATAVMQCGPQDSRPRKDFASLAARTRSAYRNFPAARRPPACLGQILRFGAPSGNAERSMRKPALK